MRSSINVGFVLLAMMAAVSVVTQPKGLTAQTSLDVNTETEGVILHQTPWLAPIRTTGAMAGKDKAERELETRTRKLLSSYREVSEPAEQSEIREQLAEVVDRHFDVRQAARAKELERLEAQVRQLRELHSRRLSAKVDIVDNRVDQLLRQATGLGWGTSSSGISSAFGEDNITPHVFRFNHDVNETSNDLFGPPIEK